MSEQRWKLIAKAPKSTSTPGKDGGTLVKAVYILAYCPDMVVASNPQSGICVAWWEPHINGGQWHGEGDFALRPTLWQQLPAAPRGEP